MSIRVTHRSLFSTNLANLQQNLSRIQQTQGQLSSGKLLSTPSDDPAGAGAALRHRSEIDRGEQLVRNASDGLAWLASADDTLGDVNDVVARVRELLVQANNQVTGGATSEAIAKEVDALREQLLGLSNTSYLGRPIFGGTTANARAYDATGTFIGDTQPVTRTIRPGVTVDVNVTGPAVFGAPGSDLFTFLADVSDHLRNDRTQLSADLGAVDGHLTNIKNAWSTVGARYAQVDTMRDRTESDLINSRTKLSEIEDIDLPATIVDLQLQETAYQAALSATARSVQPSLLDFLR